MQKRYFAVAVLTGVLAGIAVLGYLLPTDKEAVPKRILLQNTGGAVVFQHADHAYAYNVRCETCHHESPEKRLEVQACKSCHGVNFNEAFRKKHVAQFNDNAACATCHHYEAGAKKWGHERHYEELGLDCRECHHKNTDIEPEPQNCADCHSSGVPNDKPAEKGTPPNLADAVHARCVTCHEDMFAEKPQGCANCHSMKAVRDMLPKTGLVKLNPLQTNCAVCHGVTAEKLIPGAMDAFHKQCMGCHEKLGKGPFDKQQCGQCHTGK
ncbi:Multihaem cytochrome [Desulfovibrio sp. G11]|uniref:Cytochrome c3 family protein n=1 Tax=Desulfovibrio falkowii TaxID=3136602 RepID=A0ABQ0E7D6_9BACT|nr:Multihaem cytochrome [Desulfovibrio sp. G11]